MRARRALPPGYEALQREVRDRGQDEVGALQFVGVADADRSHARGLDRGDAADGVLDADAVARIDIERSGCLLYTSRCV